MPCETGTFSLLNVLDNFIRTCKLEARALLAPMSWCHDFFPCRKWLMVERWTTGYASIFLATCKMELLAVFALSLPKCVIFLAWYGSVLDFLYFVVWFCQCYNFCMISYTWCHILLTWLLSISSFSTLFFIACFALCTSGTNTMDMEFSRSTIQNQCYKFSLLVQIKLRRLWRLDTMMPWQNCSHRTKS